MAKSKVLIVDDGTHRVNLTSLNLSFEQVHPEDLAEAQVESASLVLVDFVLTDWTERDEAPLARRPADGLALSKILRRQTVSMPGPPKPIAVLTGEPFRLSEPLPPTNRSHILARINDLEWVFNKAEFASIPGRVEAIVTAVDRLPAQWPESHRVGIMKLCEMMNVPTLNREECVRDVGDANPPLHDLSVWSHGLAVLRWMLHRVLPYPSFLLDEYWLAAYLGVTPSSLRPCLAANSSLRDLLGQAEYTGILDTFSGARWWKPAVRGLFGERGAFDLRARAELARSVEPRLEPFPSEGPIVVCMDDSLEPTDEVLPEVKAVLLKPDDWPDSAMPAYSSPARLDSSGFLASIRA